jgi:hypothetical protein
LSSLLVASLPRTCGTMTKPTRGTTLVPRRLYLKKG